MNLGLTLLWFLMLVVSSFMIMLILIQRGRGGGITGALGGAGGQSAFGSKTGDVFTKITVVTAVVWILLSMITISLFNPPPAKPDPTKSNSPKVSTAPGTTDEAKDAETTEKGVDQAPGDDELILPGQPKKEGEPPTDEKAAADKAAADKAAADKAAADKAAADKAAAEKGTETDSGDSSKKDDAANSGGGETV